MSRMRIHLFWLALIGILLFLQYRLWFEPDGIRDMLVMKQRLSKQLVENQALRQQNDILLAQIKRLKNSEDAAESRARNELGMVKQDETFYQIVK